MRPAPGCCDRCGKPVGGFGSYIWREREVGAVSFAWADCGCERGTVDAAIRRRAARVSPHWARAVASQLRRHHRINNALRAGTAA
jgi:hypothetical protein